MTQARLNHLMILHYNQVMTDSLDVKAIANEFIMKSEVQDVHLPPFHYDSLKFHEIYKCTEINLLLQSTLH